MITEANVNTSNVLPTPKYQIGDKVWHGEALESTEQLPCPDCLGSHVWKVITPAGVELEAPCNRCTSGSLPVNIPGLTRRTWAPYVFQLTIGSVRIDTSDRDGAISYMCNETGVGSGTIWSERKLCSTETEAQKEAASHVAVRLLKADAEPQRIEQLRLSYLQVKDAQLDEARSAVWRSWYHYRQFREDVETAIADSNNYSRQPSRKARIRDPAKRGATICYRQWRR